MPLIWFKRCKENESVDSETNSNWIWSLGAGCQDTDLFANMKLVFYVVCQSYTMDWKINFRRTLFHSVKDRIRKWPRRSRFQKNEKRLKKKCANKNEIQ